MRLGLLIILIAASQLTGCEVTASRENQSSLSKSPEYSATEVSRMTYCVGLTDNAYTISQKKILGASSAEIKSEYSNTSQAQVTVPLVDKVFEDKPSNSWDYSISFFKECALNIAAVPEEKMNTASYCMMNAMIASISGFKKEAGIPREEAQSIFSGFNSSTPASIVNDVYNENRSRAEGVLFTWNSCIKPFSGK